MSKEAIDKQLIRELAALLDEIGLTEIEWENEDLRVRVSKSAALTAPAVPPSTNEQSTSLTNRDDVNSKLSNHPGAVKSPMVGTAYLSPEPGAARFVNVGDEVAEGQTLIIVEAMKTMNPIVAPRAGKVTQVFVSDANPVEYDEVLLLID